MTLRPTTNFKDSNGVDLGQKLVPKDYLISVYPSIGEQIGIPPELWVWGNNGLGFFTSYGRLGTNDTTTRSTPVTTFAGGTNWKQISSGGFNTAAIKTDGTLWVWGNNQSGQLGNDQTSFGGILTPITTFAGGNDWKQVSVNNTRAAAVKTDGTLWVWGSTPLGNYTSANSARPITTILGGNDWKQVSAGGQHIAAIKTDGTLWTWGSEISNMGRGFLPTYILTPITTFAGGTNWADTATTEPEDLYTLSISSNKALAIKTDGTLWTWGDPGGVSPSSLGVGEDPTIKDTPVTTFAGGTNWKKVSAGNLYSTAIKTDGTLWIWGTGNPNSGVVSGIDNSNRLTPSTTFAGGTNWADTATTEPEDLYTLSAGSVHTVAIKTDGTLWTWGYGNSGELGNSSTTGSTPVTTFAGGTDWKQVSSGGFYTAAIKTDGTLWTWGFGNSGRLGTNNSTNKNTPVTTFSGGTNWKQVSAGGSHTAAVKTDGTLWTWGNGNSGRLGTNNSTNRSTPVTTFAGGTNWKQVSAGSQHTSAIKTDGTLWVWGNGFYGQLGTNDTTNRSTPVTTFAGGTDWKQVSSGSSHTSAIKTDGTLWTWGSGFFGRLGTNDTTNRSTPVTTFAGGTDWKQVSSGSSHTSAIKTDGTLWTWGNGNSGRLGTNDTTNKNTPVTTFAGGTDWKQVSSGGYHTIALKDDGIDKQLYVFGRNTSSQLGTIIDTRFPVSLPNTDWNQVSVSSNHVAAIKTDGTLWTWGSSGNMFDGSILGTNDTSNRLTPVTTFAGGTNWKQVSAGGGNTAAIKTDGTLWVWGNGFFGRLGTNNIFQNTRTPITTFAGGTNWKQVSVSNFNTAAIKTDGTLWVWGNGFFGRLGTNDTTNRSTPVTTFAGGTDWKQVSSGENHTAAVKTDGTLWTWGRSEEGQLGTNDVFPRRLTPVTTFAGGTDWKQVSATSSNTMALRDDGVNKRLFVFGSNDVLTANNTLIKYLQFPSTTFSGGTNWKQVKSTAAIKTDGTLWVWGNGNYGRLGTNDIFNRFTPVTTFAGGTNWKQVGGGSAIKTDGTLWTWGYGLEGELGSQIISLNLYRSTPVTTFSGGTNWADTSNDLPEELYTISASNAYSEDNFSVLAIKTDGTLWTWGYNYTASLGINSNNTDSASTPVTTFAGGTNWKQVSTCTICSSAIKTDGTLWVWGNGSFAQLGNNSLGYAYTPVTTFAGGTNWKQVSISYAVGAAIKTDGTLWTWGLNVNGQIGNNTDDIVTSTPVTTFAGGTNWKQVSTGGYVVGAIKTDGTLWTWGANFYGDVGNNDQFSQPHTPVTTFAGGTNWKQVSMSRAGFVAAIKTDGTLWMWGSNRSGQLGNNQASFDEISTPITTFAGGTNWKQVSCGGNLANPNSGFTAAVKTDGTLWTWGTGYYGQLGTNDNSDKLTPVTTFTGGTNWRQVSAGGCFTIAIRGNGSSNELYSFGFSASLGINYNKGILTPITTFTGGTNWKQVSGTSAIKTDGTLWTWGRNTSAQLGVNDTTTRFTPVTTFAGGTNWKHVSGSIAIRSVDF